MSLRLLKMALIALLALVVGYATALGVGLVAFDFFEVSQREGANAMGLAFVICPFVAVLSTVVATIWYWIASGRRTATTSPAAVETPRSTAVRVFSVAMSVVVGWLAGTLLQWVLAGRSYETFVVAFTVSMTPWIGVIVLGGVTWSLTRQRKAPTS